ncbi:hypothetical protein [Kitasatospora griseola]|uniref:hypothetical protein n=1 Tax=Kitasatospora griseola TaxID=2064 RepID=UPI0037F4B922
MSGSEQQSLPPEELSSSADRELRRHSGPTRLERVLRMCGVFFDIVTKGTSAAVGVAGVLKAFGLM